MIVYTCILNDWDFLRSPGIVADNARFTCYTDRPIEPCAPWGIQPAFTPCGMSASRASRLPKILPHLHFQSEYSIWHDANFVLRTPPETLVATYLKDADIAMFAHPCRRTVAEEVKVLLDENIGNRTEVLAAQTLWLHHGAPLGLWAGGLIVRRHTHAVQQLNETWWQLFKDGCTRDQISLPLARFITDTKIATIPGNIYESGIMGFHWHAAWRSKNTEFHTREAEYKMRRARLEELAR